MGSSRRKVQPEATFDNTEHAGKDEQPDQSFEGFMVACVAEYESWPENKRRRLDDYMGYNDGSA